MNKVCTTLNSGLSSGTIPGKSAGRSADDFAITTSSHASNLETPGLEGVDPTIASPETQRDGCKACAPYVLRCAHFGGLIVRLADWAQRVTCTCRVRAYITARSRYVVVTRPEGVERACHICGQSPCVGCGWTHISAGSAKKYAESDSYDDALAAFYAAEEALLRGDA